ncbi:MAG: ABC transporter ATP-binding protein [Acidimicrobiia bacterium]|nr:ABC transporter ATP-binding protein [Acidimicrobiia bacterium]
MIPVRSYVRILRKYLRPLRGRVALLAVVALTGIALQLAGPQLIRAFLDGATSGTEVSKLIPLAVWFIGIAVLQQGAKVWATYLSVDVGWSATNDLRADLAEHVLHLDMGFHKEHTPGALIERIDGDVTALSNFFSSFTIMVLGNLILVAGILVLLWIENWLIGLGVTGFVVLIFSGMVKVQTIAVPRWKAVRARSAELMGFIGEQLGGTEDIKANGGDRFMIARFTGILRQWLPEQVRGRHGFSMLWAMGIMTFITGLSVVFFLGAILFNDGVMTLGGVYLVFHYVQMSHDPMEQIRSQMEDFQKAGAGIARVEDLLARESVIGDDGTTPLLAGPLEVDFDDVTFAYNDEEGDNDRPVLDDLNFTLPKGRVLGVLGRSGSGKSTLARLLTRLYDPQQGAIRLNGTALSEIPVEDLRHRVAMVTQDVQLFGASIRDNLTFFDDGVDDDRLHDVIDQLGLTDWLATLGDGLDSRLEASGSGLSAGQAQLLAFTRIFLRDPGVVILDEASSRLDPATEELIERAVDRLLRDRTGIIIAHRLATIERADDILILEDGVIVEAGERATLASDPDSRLSHLLATGLEEVLA